MFRQQMYTLLLLLLAATAPAQTYREIPHVGARWKMHLYSLDLGLCEWKWASYWQTTGDTMVAGLPVTKVTTEPFAVCHEDPCWPGLEPHKGTQYIHQDSFGGVFWVDTSGLVIPIIDYSLQPGDTLHDSVSITFGPNWYVVDSVDTVTYADAIPRKRLYVTRIYGSFMTWGVWVEGVGDQTKGLFPYWEFEAVSSCMCYKEAGLMLHDGVGPFWSECSNECDQLAVGQTEVKTVELQAHPNPSDGTWRIDLPPGMDLHRVTVQDITGKLVSVQTFDYGAPPLIRLGAEIPSGQYLARIEWTTGGSTTVKLMKTSR